MKISVVYAKPGNTQWLHIQVPFGTNIEQAIQQSGILERCPEIDLKNQKVGIYGKFAKLENLVKDGDRVEIYRAITADPKTVPRRAGAEDS